ncbi:uncharacterized protein APUU_70807S [Aspergillus puulaauensis]|uniref:Uncharacterized protein n=1 Tax=Aspergillus puulaauensis TaxID=1220207 RepID=A0A7R7XXF8_9EURO|nr:uncharacterized protein APUU_70807S [Aspergillus puulaauensis]BCS29237.1 hypothetical protein APUU_70807S [Aspergillus puulaauensis]
MCLGIIRNLFPGHETFEDLAYQFAVDWNRLQYNYLPRSYYKKACDFAWWYMDNREKRNAILQRMRQLKQNSDVYQYNLLQNQTSTKRQFRSPDQMSMDMVPEYDPDAYTEEDRRRELQVLNAEFRRIQLKLFDKWHDAPDDAAARLFKLRFGHKDREGRSDIWYNERRSCSVGGGCCGRACGCCEKPLHEYYVDTGRMAVAARSTEGKELVRVYGHCTAECACCVITHGVYNPRQDLPKPKFAR